MSAFVIAVAGKGGTGKTTLCALIIRHLLKEGKSILAIDADANANLYHFIGVELKETIADIVDETKEKQINGLPAGMTKDRYIEYRLQNSLSESRGVDLLTMGRPEGPGCYCYPNTLLRGHIDNLSKSYSFVVMDNEAGMEHLSRRTTRDVNLLFITSEPTRIGLRAAQRIYEVSRELKILVGKAGLVLCRVADEVPGVIMEEIEKMPLPLWGKIPLDDNIPVFDLEKKPLLDLPDDSPAVKSVENLMEKIKGK